MTVVIGTLVIILTVNAVTSVAQIALANEAANGVGTCGGVVTVINAITTFINIPTAHDAILDKLSKSRFAGARVPTVMVNTVRMGGTVVRAELAFVNFAASAIALGIDLIGCRSNLARQIAI